MPGGDERRDAAETCDHLTTISASPAPIIPGPNQSPYRRRPLFDSDGFNGRDTGASVCYAGLRSSQPDSLFGTYLRKVLMYDLPIALLLGKN